MVAGQSGRRRKCGREERRRREGDEEGREERRERFRQGEFAADEPCRLI